MDDDMQISMDEYFKTIKDKIAYKYYDLFIFGVLANAGDYFFVKDYIKFDIVDIFFEPYKYTIAIRIESTDIKIQEFLKSKNIDFGFNFGFNFDLFQTKPKNINIEELQYNEQTIQIILDIIDFIYKNYSKNINEEYINE
jgi:hypothetical protein